MDIQVSIEDKMRAEQSLLQAAAEVLRLARAPTATVVFPDSRPPLFILIGTEYAMPELLVQAARQLRQQR